MTADRAQDPSLPTFLVIGAMKAGTTSLHRYLRSHPDVFMPEHKEIEFFSEERVWSRGIGWYRTLFTDGRTARARGEASTGYTKLPRFPEAAQRISRLLPEVRLIYVVRDPIDRMRSHYVHNVLRGLERRTIAEALLSGEHYLPVSSYFTQLSRYLDHVDRQRVLVVSAEDLRDQRRETVTRVLTFIGADPSVHLDDLDAEHHVTDERLRLQPRLHRLARSRAVEALRERAPKPITTLARRVLARPASDVDANISADLRRRLAEALHDDLDQLRTYLGGLPASWTTPEA